MLIQRAFARERGRYDRDTGFPALEPVNAGVISTGLQVFGWWPKSVGPFRDSHWGQRRRSSGHSRPLDVGILAHCFEPEEAWSVQGFSPARSFGRLPRASWQMDAMRIVCLILTETVLVWPVEGGF